MNRLRSHFEMMHLVRVIVCLLLSGLVAAGQQSVQQARETGALSPNSRAVVVGPDDTVTIFALNTEEISKAWRVSASGDLNLPMIGRIHAAGLTVEQLQQEITARLTRFVRNPQVTAYVSEFRSHPVTVSGGVEHPGVIQLQGSTTLFDAIVQAGGPKDAGPTVTLSRNVEYGPIPYSNSKRSSDGKYNIVKIPTADVMKGSGEAADIPVRAFDVVTVSEGAVKKLIYLVGEFNRPGAIELVHENSISISKAVAIAGGFTRTASPGKTMIRHVDSKGTETETTSINLKKIVSGKSPDVRLKDGDIVIVPPNKWTSYLSTVGTAAITTGIYILARY